MRALRISLVLLALLAAAPAWCIDIVQVLERSQRMRMQAYAPSPADGERVGRVRASFDRLVDVMEPPRPLELRIGGGGLGAEAMLGHVIVASDTLAVSLRMNVPSLKSPQMPVTNTLVVPFSICIRLLLSPSSVFRPRMRIFAAPENS